ncbi:MAG: gamma-glutamyl-gamma-aminobutyrate hydrolase family protein [Chloroflexi bacterium]|nr:gamma-glutamyl-gamma-aminobutyrate hydrolase family protein [Chloroflexota bacterium]MCL5274197.1 gamma-glutamyl-gamma-aminobutyrate hydrolase family protein [Chloroflexota bacterium]
MSKPLILIPTPVQGEQHRSFSMGKGYIESLIAAGGVPLLVPVTVDELELRALYESASGVLLAGGGDVDPAEYGEEKHEKTGNIDRDRDHAEFLISRWAVADDKPIFGICRGIQSLNAALGGTLVQDIPSQWSTALRHNGHYDNAARDEVLHEVSIESGSRIEAIMENRTVGVNSFHHQAVERPADGFVITSRATDGVIEGMEMPGKRFVVSVQWHPEEMSRIRADMLNLFVKFVSACTV